MPDYERSATALTVAALPDRVRTAIAERVTATQLTVAEDAPAYLTRSRRLRKPGVSPRITGMADRHA